MLVDVIPNINELQSDHLQGKTVIVIDVLRATSTIITALAHGCCGIIPVETVCQAKQFQHNRPILLGGERSLKKIQGFDLGNSPLEYTQETVRGRMIVFTTTNGTRALQKTMKGNHVIAGAFLNATACVNYASQLGKDIVIICAGTKDQFALEDGLCAGLLADKLSAQQQRIHLNDLGKAMRAAYKQVEYNLFKALLSGDNGQRMDRIGMREDVEFCSQIDRYSLVPLLQDQVLRATDKLSSKFVPST